MNMPLTLSFEGIPVIVRRAAEGRLWFDAAPVCQVLRLQNENATLLKYCRPEGILFGHDETPLAMIDMENLLRLSLYNNSERAERLRDWLYQSLLPNLFNDINLPTYCQLDTPDRRLRVLKWHDDWWMSVNDAMQMFGNRPQEPGKDKKPGS